MVDPKKYYDPTDPARRIRERKPAFHFIPLASSDPSTRKRGNQESFGLSSASRAVLQKCEDQCNDLTHLSEESGDVGVAVKTESERLFSTLEALKRDYQRLSQANSAVEDKAERPHRAKVEELHTAIARLERELDAMVRSPQARRSASTGVLSEEDLLILSGFGEALGRDESYCIPELHNIDDAEFERALTSSVLSASVQSNTSVLCGETRTDDQEPSTFAEEQPPRRGVGFRRSVHDGKREFGKLIHNDLNKSRTFDSPVHGQEDGGKNKWIVLGKTPVAKPGSARLSSGRSDISSFYHVSWI